MPAPSVRAFHLWQLSSAPCGSVLRLMLITDVNSGSGFVWRENMGRILKRQLKLSACFSRDTRVRVGMAGLVHT